MNRNDDLRPLNELQAAQPSTELRDVALAAGNVLLPYLVAALMIVGFQ